MNSFDSGNFSTQILIWLAIIAIAFLILREVVCWYWKINQSVGLLKEIRDLLITAQSVHANFTGNPQPNSPRSSDRNDQSGAPGHGAPPVTSAVGQPNPLELEASLTRKGYKVSRNGSSWQVKEPLGGTVKLDSWEQFAEYARGR